MITLMSRYKTILLSLMVFLVASTVSWAAAVKGDQEKKTAYKINSVKWEQTAEDFLLRINGGSPPTYTMYELFDPLRVVIDIADASLAESVKLPLDLPHGPVSLVNGQVLKDKEPFITRLEIFLNADNTYTVEREDNDIIVKFSKEGGVIAQKTTPPATKPSTNRAPQKVSSPSRQSALQDSATEIYSIDVEKIPGETRIYLRANGPITDYKKEKLARNIEADRPERLYIDIDKINIKGSLPSQKIGTAVSQVRAAKRNEGIRVVFDTSGETLFDYEIIPQKDGLMLAVSEDAGASSVIAEMIEQEEEKPMVSQDVIASVIQEATEPEQLFEPEAEISDETVSMDSPMEEIVEQKKTSKAAAKTSTEEPLDDFAFAGYKKQRISVDFYKIDLHNVFRLIGEISNLNIVVSEEVGGSLTLSLTDVPWDFALDIILNLKDLQKEERFNTIVISQKSKNFTWPERAMDTVTFKEDETIKEETPEALSFKAVEDVPETIVQARKLIHQAQLLEKSGNYAGSLPLYEEALKKWPDNNQLANQIAALCLVQLQMNAKAIHYAKTALKIKQDDYNAALNAAIGLAKMKKSSEALEYFDIAVSGPQPSSEALTSYAAYNEEQGRFDASLSLLKKHEEMYGDSLQSMISKARIFDKQGNSARAVDEYRAIMLSGYDIPADLKRYIKGRITLASN